MKVKMVLPSPLLLQEADLLAFEIEILAIFRHLLTPLAVLLDLNRIGINL